MYFTPAHISNAVAKSKDCPKTPDMKINNYTKVILLLSWVFDKNKCMWKLKCERKFTLLWNNETMKPIDDRQWEVALSRRQTKWFSEEEQKKNGTPKDWACNKMKEKERKTKEANKLNCHIKLKHLHKIPSINISIFIPFNLSACNFSIVRQMKITISWRGRDVGIT